MKKLFTAVAALALCTGLVQSAQASPEEDLKEFRAHFQDRFPDVKFQDFTNGVYAVNADARMSWEAIEEFPPYEDALDKGEKLFNTEFANGKTYGNCFKNGGIGIRQNYPYFDTKTGQVKTLEMEINECREKNGEKPLPWAKGDIAAISAYMASTSEGKKIKITIPNDERALAAYERGKMHFYAKRGQLNLSCANCHFDSAGKMIRADTLSPALGHPSHFPVHRLKWDGLGTLHRRFGGCNKQVRAAPFKAQSEEYRALEYFLTYMSNGIKISTKRSRK